MIILWHIYSWFLISRHLYKSKYFTTRCIRVCQTIVWALAHVTLRNVTLSMRQPSSSLDFSSFLPLTSLLSIDSFLLSSQWPFFFRLPFYFIYLVVKYKTKTDTHQSQFQFPLTGYNRSSCQTKSKQLISNKKITLI